METAGLPACYPLTLLAKKCLCFLICCLNQGNANQNSNAISQFTPFRIVIIRKKRNYNCWPRCGDGEKGTLVHCLWECKWDATTVENSVKFLQKIENITAIQFGSVTESCPALCDPMNHSMPGLPVHHRLPESTETHVHRVDDAIQPSYPLLSSSPSALNLSQH